MGFDWGVDISVEYNQPLQWTGLLKLLNSFLTFRNDAGALGPRALAARESGQVARRTRASVGEKRGAEEIEGEEDWYRAPSPEEIPEGERREFLNRELVDHIVYEQNGRWYYYDGWEDDPEIEYQDADDWIVNEAFGLAMKEVVGEEWAEKIALRWSRGGADFEADEGAEEESFRLAYAVRSPSFVGSVPGLDAA